MGGTTTHQTPQGGKGDTDMSKPNNGTDANAGSQAQGQQPSGNAAPSQSQQVDSSAASSQNQPAGDSVLSMTEAELNARIDSVVKARIDKQNEKHAKELADKDAELAEANSQISELTSRLGVFEADAARKEIVDKVASETGLPAAQVALLQGDSEEDLRIAADSLKASMPAFYPQVPEAGAGTTPPLSKEDITSTKSTEERVVLMGKHPELFGR